MKEAINYLSIKVKSEIIGLLDKNLSLEGNSP